MENNEKIIEIETLKLERTKIYVKFTTAIFALLFGTVGVTLINADIQKRKISQLDKQHKSLLNYSRKKQSLINRSPK